MTISAEELLKIVRLRNLDESYDESSVRSLIEDVQIGLKSLFELCGEDPNREGLLDSPVRILKAFLEVTSGNDEDPRTHLRKQFSSEGSYSYSQMILSREIPFVSICEHHWLPFTGVAHVAYIPNPNTDAVVGLSKLARVVEGYAKRPQVQEKLTAQIAEAINDVLEPLGVGVVLKGTHSCQQLRGVKKSGVMVTSALHGVLHDDPSARSEFFRLIEL